MPQNPHHITTQQHIIDDYILCYRDSSSIKPKVIIALYLMIQFYLMILLDQR